MGYYHLYAQLLMESPCGCFLVRAQVNFSYVTDVMVRYHHALHIE